MAGLRSERTGFARLTLTIIFVLAPLAGCAKHNAATHPPANTPAPQPSGAPQPGQAGPSHPSGPPPAIERQPAVPGEYVEEGVASWYGVPFTGGGPPHGGSFELQQINPAQP